MPSYFRHHNIRYFVLIPLDIHVRVKIPNFDNLLISHYTRRLYLPLTAIGI